MRGAYRNADPDTSVEAACSFEAGDLEAIVLSALLAQGPHGATIDELTRICDRQKVALSPRLRPLCRKGLVTESGRKRVGCSGRSQTVWVATASMPWMDGDQYRLMEV